MFFFINKMNSLSDKTLANLAMLFTVVCWGISFISIKIVVSEIPPITTACIRFLITSIFLFLALKKIEPTHQIKKNIMPKLVLGGFLGITLYFCCENTGIKLTTASNASLITSLVPILAIGLDIVFFKSKISLSKICGIIIALIGTYLIITASGNVDFSSDNFKGNMFMIGAMTSWAFYTILNKFLQDKHSALFLVTYQTIFGALFLIPLSLFEFNSWHSFSLSAFGNILFLSILCSALCYFLYSYSLKNLDVTVTTIYLNLTPVIGIISGYLILNETILPIQLLGGLLVITSIYIANR